MKSHFDSWRHGVKNRSESVGAANERLTGGPPSPRLDSQKVRIIYTASDQLVPSLNGDVFPQEKGQIKDPIVSVMTASNSYPVDRINMITGSGNDALKIKIPGGESTEDVLGNLRPTLERLHLADNLTRLETPSQSILADAQAIQRAAVDEMWLAVAGVVIGLFLCLQGATLIFGLYTRQIVVRSLAGAPYLRAAASAIIWSLVPVLVGCFAGAVLARNFGTIAIILVIVVAATGLLVLYSRATWNRRVLDDIRTGV